MVSLKLNIIGALVLTQRRSQRSVDEASSHVREKSKSESGDFFDVSTSFLTGGEGFEGDAFVLGGGGDVGGGRNSVCSPDGLNIPPCGIDFTSNGFCGFDCVAVAIGLGTGSREGEGSGVGSASSSFRPSTSRPVSALCSRPHFLGSRQDILAPCLIIRTEISTSAQW